MPTLYHATHRRADALDIEAAGFRGGDHWEHRDVVFLADRPLPGFGEWDRNAWVAVEVPDDALAAGEYPEQDSDDDLYRAHCYCYRAEMVNQWPRRAYLDQVPGFDPRTGRPEED